MLIKIKNLQKNKKNAKKVFTNLIFYDKIYYVFRERKLSSVWKDSEVAKRGRL